MGECKHVFFHNFSEDSPEKLVIFPEQTLSEPLKETNKQEFGEMLNGMPSGVFVGNGFMSRATWFTDCVTTWFTHLLLDRSPKGMLF